MEPIDCLIEGCDWQVDPDIDPAWRETFEQHVRWIHVPTREFGTAPIASLTGLMMNGMIGPDEFAEFSTKVLQDAYDKVQRPERRRSAKIASFVMALGFASWLLYAFAPDQGWVTRDIDRGAITLAFLIAIVELIRANRL